MKRILTPILFLFFVVCSTAQNTSKPYAIIEFAGEKTNNTRTYLGKLKKGDPYRLKDYLQSGTNDQTGSTTDDAVFMKEYAPRADRNETHYLTKDYKINEKKLKKRKARYYKKYLAEKEKAFSDEEKVKRSEPRQEKKKKKQKGPRKKDTRLAKKFKISGKRLHQGKKLKYRAGNVYLLLKYKVKTNNTVKTYVTDLSVKVEAGKKYYLKYYGNESQRRYYLEAATGTNE